MLLTGFEPFTTGQGLVLTHNPTADIVQRVAERTPEVATEVLPVSYQATPLALHRAFDRHHPRVWIGLGFAPHRSSLDIEVFALNMAHAARGDNDGACPSLQEIVPGGPPAYRTRLELDTAIATLAEHGVTAVPAFHAGTFLCNQVFYLGCHRCETGDLKLAAFIHVPPMEDYEPLASGLVALLQTTASRLSD